ncbi:hypothetical protein [Erythrobacter dokdonensis]|uniref:DUF2834 domain-containing protein n=1 Tax=Erythrobacter dokdonensis DSW-74 TaxID=1300349 RepID=A0A1A7BKL0_9SPHN|nr:hypothetical protein [Erythrobacter dokdonensis]OBV12261.1 hypothetical protein I603_0392 [Erythrobacter dokdonensis DSW-74]
MPNELTPFLALAGGGLVWAVAAILSIMLRPNAPGSALLAASLAAGFAAFTAITIATEGVFPVVLNHTSNLWGVQVWWDLLLSLSVAYFLIAPRARAQGMNLPLWTVFILATASIGLLAMCARLFWQESKAKAASS